MAKTRTSPLAPTDDRDNSAYKLTNDASAKVRPGSTRPRDVGSAPGNDSALGVKGNRSRSATTAGAQFRITAKRAPYDETYPATLANGRILPAIMGQRQRQNFDADAGWSQSH